MSKASVVAAYGRSKPTPVPAGRITHVHVSHVCGRCECPVVMGGIPDCPVACDCHTTALRWFGGPNDLKESL